MRKKNPKKRLVILILCILFSIGIIRVYAATSGGTITTAITSSTSLTITVTTAASTLDSLYVCYFKGTSADTTFAALLDSTAADTTITALSQATQYIVFLLARQTAGQTAISDKDTVNTYPVALGDPTRTGFLTRKLTLASSWPPSGSFDRVFDLNGASALDSSLVYYAKTYNGLDVYATQAGDSCKAGIYAIPVNWSGIFSDYGTWYEDDAIADSLAVSTAGLTRKTLSLPVGRYYIFRIRTHTGNGKDADYEITFTSDGN